VLDLIGELPGGFAEGGHLDSLADVVEKIPAIV
jgi:hypothetical protein